MKNIYESAVKLSNDELFPQEVKDFNGDFYVLNVLINGENKDLVMSKIHLNYFAALFNEGDSEIEDFEEMMSD